MSIKTFPLFLSVTLFLGSVNAQITFERDFGSPFYDEGYAGIQINEGYVISGFVGLDSPYIHRSVYVAKLNSYGDTLWTTKIGVETYCYPYDMIETYDKGYIVAGTKLDPSQGIKMFLVKLDANGDSLWSRIYGGIGNDVAYSVVETPDSGLLIAGSTTSAGAGDLDAYLVKTNSIGDILWTKTFGGIKTDMALSIIITSDNNVVFAGEIMDSIDNIQDVYVVKTDLNGVVIWERSYKDSVSLVASSIKETNDNGYIVAGKFGAGNYIIPSILLLKINAGGDSVWLKTYGVGDYSFANSVTQTPDEGYAIAGYSQSGGIVDRAYLVKTNSAGDTLWTQHFSGDIFYDVTVTSDNGLFLTGFSDGTDRNLYCVKTNEDGVLLSEFSPDFNPEIIHVFPQPASNKLTIELGGYALNCSKVCIYDNTGKQVKEIKLNKSQLTFTVPAYFNNGLYLFALLFNDGTVKTCKVLIQR